MNEKTKSRLLQCTTTTIADVLMGHGLRNVFMHGVAPLRAGQSPMVGPAFTLRFMPSREDIDTMANYASETNIHRRAIEECPPDSVLVIDAMGVTTASSAGDMMAERLNARGVAGVVTDGGFRDAPGVIESGISAFHHHPAPPSTILALHPVELNAPIGCAGVPVYPGDIIVGDSEGVVVIPAALADEVSAKAQKRADYEAFAKAELRKGRSIFGLFPATPDSQQEYETWKTSSDDPDTDD